MTAPRTTTSLFPPSGSTQQREVPVIDNARPNDSEKTRLEPLGSNRKQRSRSKKDEGSKKLRPRDAPTTGWRAMLTDLVVALGKPNWAPRPSEEEMRQRKVAALISEVWSLMDRTERFACAVINRKGGTGKTPLISHLACRAADLVGGEISFYDGNPGSGASSQIMAMYSIESDGVMPEWARLAPRMPGMNRETISVLNLRKLLNQHGSEMTTRELFNLVRQNHYGVSTVVSHQRPKVQGEHFSAAMIQETLVPVIDNSRLTFIDTGNEATSSSQLKIVEDCSCLVFVAAIDQEASLNDLRQHIGILKDHGFGHKVDSATVVLLGIPEGESVDDYRHHAGYHPGPVLGIPDDEQMKLCQPVMLDRLRQDTRDALLEVLVSLLKQNLRQGNETEAHPIYSREKE